jgi:Na+-transporting NADH:ubiquinone oxidoreductase subunit C
MFSNKYILLYAAATVVLVAFALTLVAVQLKPYQEKNIRIEKIQNILASVNITSSKKDAEELYKKYITKTIVINSEGKEIDSIDAFKIDLAVELKKPIEKRLLPIFICTQDNGEKNYSVPLRGKGLWGPIWGYISFKNDFNTISGAIFDHKSETPGLGAEINTQKFQKQFFQKNIFDNKGNFVSVKALKNMSIKDSHTVDAISGGTITSNGLNQMLFDCLKMYEKYFKQKAK